MEKSMHKPSSQSPQHNHRIIIESDGRLFVGLRTPRAFVWEEAGMAPARRPKASPVLSDTVLGYINGAGLTREDKQQCRRQVAAMPAGDLHWLANELRHLRGSKTPR